MNTTGNVSFGSGVGPSGFEVESASFHPEVSRSNVIRTRFGDLKSRSLSKVHDVRKGMTDRTALIKSNVQHSMTTAKTSAQRSMRNHPARWAGIAAGSGFVLGLLGRFIQSRNEHRHHMPELVVIETSW